MREMVTTTGWTGPYTSEDLCWDVTVRSMKGGVCNTLHIDD